MGLPLLFLLLLAVAPLWIPPYWVVSFNTIFMYIILTLSWAIFSGPTRYISLATAAFFGVGVYAMAMMGQELPFPIVIALSGGLSFILALFIGFLTLRLKGVYFIIFTFGISELIRHLVLWWETKFTGTVGRWVLMMDYTTAYYFLLAIFVITVLSAHIIRSSKFGLALKGIGEYEEAALHIGIDVTTLKTITFAVSAFFMGATGAIMATRWTYIDPTIAFNPLFSFMPVLMAIFGGIGPFYGPLLGAAIFAILEEVLITKFPYYYMLLFGIILIAVILFLPNGLVGLLKKGEKRV
ncbi:MAG: branched-chain amino acid ABC transporter permease [Deltaproteobacteria bacterium]|nr:branched-chain amino acid ABC transporter permease [Deltaproteobacteria bacterium]